MAIMLFAHWWLLSNFVLHFVVVVRPAVEAFVFQRSRADPEPLTLPGVRKFGLKILDQLPLFPAVHADEGERDIVNAQRD